MTSDPPGPRPEYPEVRGHTPGPWIPADTPQCDGDMVHSDEYDKTICAGTLGVYDDMAIEKANAALIALATAAPHLCSDPSCPGDRNRRKLQAAEKLYREHRQFGEWDFDAEQEFVRAWEAANE